MARAINRCPNCREPVTPFAAGCAICGTDLEKARAELKAKSAGRPSVRLPNLPGAARVQTQDVDWLQLLIALAVAVFIPPIGLILSLYWARQQQFGGGRLMMRLLLGTAAVAVAAILFPLWFWSHVYGGV